jgi:glucoside 3-dehydrogenase (cytochrome c) hitch-hiker subunit
VSESRRQAIKMLGAIGVTCAFPFEGEELYGQHVHVTLAQVPSSTPYAPTFFTSSEYATLSRLTDVIIPPTDTPGASAAGVPEYIDRVVSLNREHQPLIRAGLAWLERQSKARFSRDFLALDDSQHAAILQALSDEIDRQRREAQQRRFLTEASGKRVYYVALTDKDVATPAAATIRPPDDAELPTRFFHLVKNLTADGYYTSRAGLLDELGYNGNKALAQFPSCAVPEH